MIKNIETSSSESGDSDEIIATLSDSLRKEEIEYNKRQRLATIAAVTLLALTAILIINAIFTPGNLKYIFGSGSIVTTLGQYWPIKFLLQDKREGFKAKALTKIMSSSNLDKDKLDKALELMDKIQGSMKNADNK